MGGEAARTSVRPDAKRPARGVSEFVLPVVRWCAWGLDAAPAVPDVSFLEPGLRRRLSPLARSALAAAESTRPSGRPVRFVFASRHGELKRNAEMLQELADGQAPSPMNFSLSVLNAVAGLFGIAHRDASASSAVSAGRATLPLALLEGAAQAWAHPGASVLVVCADEPPPALYADLVDEPKRPCALAVLLSANEATIPVRTAWCRDTREASSASAADAFVECVQSRRPVRWATGDQAWTWEPQVPARH